MNTGLQFQPLSPPWAVLFVAVALAGAVYLYYLRWDQGISRRRRVVLSVLRMAAVACIIFALAGPVRTGRRERRSEAGLAVLVDVSASMAVEDAGEGGARERLEAARAALLEAMPDLVGRYDLKVYSFDASARFLGSPSSRSQARRMLEDVAPEGKASALGEALVQAAPPSPGSAVLILSDGASNRGLAVAAAARELAARGVEVYAVAFGTAGALNVKLECVMGPRLLLRGEPSAFFAQVSATGPVTGPVRVVLEAGGETLASVEADPARGSRLVRLNFTPKGSGSQTFTVRAQPLPAESNSADNSIERTVEVVAEKLKVLFVEERPRWEYRFLKNAVLRDDRLDTKFLLVTGEGELADAPYHVGAFPATRRALFDFDVVVIGDVPVRFFLPRDLENLRAFVSEGGGGLLMVGGEFHNPGGYSGTVLGELAPVELEGRPLRAPEGMRLTLSDAGSANPALSLSAGDQREFWKGLPAIKWLLDVKARPAATVLAVTVDGAEPVILEQRFGRGTVVFMATDELWRWRRFVGDRYLYRLWVQLVRYLGAKRLGAGGASGELTVASQSHAEGEMVEATAYLENALAMPLEEPAVAGFLEGRAPGRTAVAFSRAPEGGGLYRARFPAGAPGRYTLVVAGPQGVLSADFSVTDTPVEAFALGPDVAALAGLAAATGGRLLRPDEIGRLDEWHPPKYGTRVETRTRVLWSSWLLLLPLASALALEWVLRKRWGLP